MRTAFQYSTDPTDIDTARAQCESLALQSGCVRAGVKDAWVNDVRMFYAYAVFPCDALMPLPDGCRYVIIPDSYARVA